MMNRPAKRILSLLLAMTLLFACVPALASGLTKEERYNAAMTELERYFNGESTLPMSELVTIFDQLGQYQNSIALTLYTMVLSGIDSNSYGRVYQLIGVLRMDGKFVSFLEEKEIFGTLDALESYAHARQAEHEGRTDEAVLGYERCMGFMDSMARWNALQTAELDGVYQQAMALYQSGTVEGYQQSWELFTTLGDYRDSQAYALKADVLRIPPEPTATPVPEITPAPTPEPVPTPDPAAVARMKVVAGSQHTVGLCSDGTVVATGRNQEGQCNVEHWKNMVDIAAGDTFTVGLRADGSLAFAGKLPTRGDIYQWYDIVRIEAGGTSLLALRSDGHLYLATNSEDMFQRASNLNNRPLPTPSASATPQANAVPTLPPQSADSANSASGDDAAVQPRIVDMAVSSSSVAFVLDNGCGYLYKWDNSINYNTGYRLKALPDSDVISASAHGPYLKKDGTIGEAWYTSPSLYSWNNITMLACSNAHILGLEADGTVLASPHHNFHISTETLQVAAWQDIVWIAAGNDFSVGVRSDGTVLATGANNYHQCDVSDWNLLK